MTKTHIAVTVDVCDFSREIGLRPVHFSSGITIFPKGKGVFAGRTPKTSGDIFTLCPTILSGKGEDIRQF